MGSRKLIGLVLGCTLTAAPCLSANADECTSLEWNSETFTATAYCGCEDCSERWGSQTATGVTAQEGRTIAVDKNVIPLGSTVCVYIDNELYGIFIAEDVGGAIKGNKIDIYFDNHEECTQFGKKEVEVVVYDAKG